MESVEKPVYNMGARCVNLTFCTIFLINLSFKLSQIQKWQFLKIGLNFAAAQIVLQRGLAAVGYTVKMLAEGKFIGIPAKQESPRL